MLWSFGRRGLKASQGLGHVTGHQYVYCACNIVPLQRQPTVLRACPINGNAVEEKEGVDEVLRVVLANIFYTEVVNNQGKSDWSCLVGK